MLSKFFSITPSDSAIVEACEAIYVGGTGSLVITHRISDGSGAWTEVDTVLNGVAAGVWHPISPYKIKAASSATGIVGAR